MTTYIHAKQQKLNLIPHCGILKVLPEKEASLSLVDSFHNADKEIHKTKELPFSEVNDFILNMIPAILLTYGPKNILVYVLCDKRGL